MLSLTVFREFKYADCKCPKDFTTTGRQEICRYLEERGCAPCFPHPRFRTPGHPMFVANLHHAPVPETGLAVTVQTPPSLNKLPLQICQET